MHNLNDKTPHEMHIALKKTAAAASSREIRNRLSANIVTGYGLDGEGTGVQFLAGASNFSHLKQHPYWSWGPSSVMYNGYQGLFPI
jgi:hypothetical protein